MRRIHHALLLMAVVTPFVSGQPTMIPAIEKQARPFPLEAVRLLDGPFKTAQETNAAYLFHLEPDRLLHGFLREAGLEPKAPVYGGWESMGVAGHTLGHYLSALSMYHAATGSEEASDRISYIVNELTRVQNVWGDGYVAAIPDGRTVFDRVANGDIETSPFRLNGEWAPWYTIHKQLAGLVDAWRYTHNEQALVVAMNLADWADQTTTNLSPDLWQKMLACEHGGMNEVLADLYAITGNPSYLDLSRKFHHQAVLGPLADHIEILDGLHANTQIPKVIGVTRQYELIGNDSLKTVADFFWEAMTGHHAYAIGGNSLDEHLGEPDKLADRLNATTAETCNTYNMLRLTRHLFTLSPQPRYAEFYERALYNHILASQEPETGMFTYYMSLKPGHFKTYSSPDDAFWCCVGSGIENHTKYGDSIYFFDDNGIWINLYIASSLHAEEFGLDIVQTTRFPDEDRAKFTVQAENPVETTLRFRIPAWTENGVSILLNGQSFPTDAQPGSYASIHHTWEDGDTVEISLPMSLRLESMPDRESQAAIMYGPIVLAGVLGTANMPEDGAFSDSDVEFVELPTPSVPVLVASSEQPEDWIKPLAGDPLTFHTVGSGRPADILLKPFFRTHNERYSVYWDIFTETEWQQTEAAYRQEEEKQRHIEESTLDVMRLGEMLGEEKHQFLGEKTEKGLAFGRRYRVAENGGWFSFNLDKPASTPVSLMCTYWSVERGNRTFDILVDGEKLVTETLENTFPDAFVDRIYEIPSDVTVGKTSVTVRFEAGPRQKAGRVFGCRLLERTN